MNSLKMSLFERFCGSSNAINGDIINEWQGTETAGASGRSQKRQTQCRSGRASDGNMLSASQADLASLPEGGRRGSGTSQSRPARCAAQSGQVATQGAGAIRGALPGFWPDACGGASV